MNKVKLIVVMVWIICTMGCKIRQNKNDYLKIISPVEGARWFTMQGVNIEIDHKGFTSFTVCLNNREIKASYGFEKTAVNSKWIFSYVVPPDIPNGTGYLKVKGWDLDGKLVELVRDVWILSPEKDCQSLKKLNHFLEGNKGRL